jgi:monoamine oxidase
VGWAAGKCARPLIGKSTDQLEQEALRSLAPLMDETPDRLKQRLRGFYSHDWQSDPYSLGAYSYAEVGGSDASKKLAEPIDRTLFFAGEATEYTGHSSTVHGAIRSGRRAADQVLAMFR